MAKSKTPLMDEVEAIGQEIMGGVEQHIEQLLADNLSYGVLKLIGLLYNIARLTLGEDNQNVKRLKHLMVENEALIQEVVDNKVVLQKRFSETSKERPCVHCGKSLVCHSCGNAQ